MTAANKNSGPKFYWWGIRKWHSSVFAKRVADTYIIGGKLIAAGGAIVGVMSKFGTHPAIVMIARTCGLGISYIGR